MHLSDAEHERLSSNAAAIFRRASSGTVDKPGPAVLRVASRLLAVLYFRWLRVDPTDSTHGRDRFILGDRAALSVLYATLLEAGFIYTPPTLGDEPAFARLGSEALADVGAVDAGSEAFENGLGVAVGVAIASRAVGNGARVVVLLDDHTLDEALESGVATLAARAKLGNLVTLLATPVWRSPQRIRRQWERIGWKVEAAASDSVDDIARTLDAVAVETDAETPTLVVIVATAEPVDNR
ncbi:MAG TPA: hypothetical protein VG346_11905 [Acidimicrobiales bacterium]|jgi:transketolase N-terminal domain/subunit|nr:hypothetical protein [Acidimicrobiales bacterium]